MSLEVRGITFSYKNGSDVLQDFTASFAETGITALTGGNGSGKTTLARVIMGILTPQKGIITIDGETINGYSLAQRGKLIGYVMQNPARQIFSDTAEEEVMYGLRNLGLPEEEIRRRTEYYMKYFEIDMYRNTFPFELSQGEKQRLVLAAITAMEPKYLLLDEPTVSLDSRRRELLGELLTKVKTRCGIIAVTHDRTFTEKYCDAEVRMNEHNRNPQRGSADAQRGSCTGGSE